MAASLEEKIAQLCYQRIRPHLERYQAEPDIEKCLPLMDSLLFAGFADQACRDVARLVVRCADKQYHHQARTTDPAALLDLRVESGDEDVLADKLASFTGFTDALSQYDPVLQRFRRLAAHAHEAAFRNGSAIGEWAGGTFGGLAGLLVSVAGGFLASSAIDREMQAESERLQQAFCAMLQAYDQAVANITQNAVNLLAWHRKELRKAVRNGSDPARRSLVHKSKTGDNNR